MTHEWKSVTISFTNEEYQAIRHMAYKLDRTKSFVIRKLLQYGLGKEWEQDTLEKQTSAEKIAHDAQEFFEKMEEPCPQELTPEILTSASMPSCNEVST